MSNDLQYKANINLFRFLLAFISLSMLLNGQAHAESFTWVEGRLAEWQYDTKFFMSQLPVKTGAHVPPQRSNGDWFQKKNLMRERILGGPLTSRSEILGHDRAQDMVDMIQDPNGQWIAFLDRLDQMETSGLKTATTGRQPWSDSYWPLFKGGVSARYGAPGFPEGSKDWRDFERFSHNAIPSDALSPTEKYEYVLGNVRHPLTDSMWSLGKYYFDKFGVVEDWIGICHGWSYASFDLPRPRHSVQLKVKDAAGKENLVTFFPSDIKALGSLMWSKHGLMYRFIGRRCSEKNPPVDANGRIDAKFPECLDTNPGTWHQALVNQVGLRKRSFVFDSIYDYEVWNYPVRNYRYTYFNPETRKQAATLAEATSAKGFSGDKYAAYRAQQTTQIVGIAMEVDYIDEVDPPTQNPSNSEANDAVTTVQYLYDLELDANQKIIGGEWYQNAHPDFLWTLPIGTVATSPGDSLITETWDGTSALPRSWLDAGWSSADRQQLLPALIERIFLLSQ